MKHIKTYDSITEGTYNSKDHIGSTSDGQGANAEIYKKGKGYYVVVSGEVDYDFTAKNDKELLQKLDDAEFDSTDIVESVNEYGGSEWSKITSLQNYLTIDLDKFEKGLKDSKHKAAYKKARKQFMKTVSEVAFEHSKLHEGKVNEEDYEYKKYVSKAFDNISDAMFEFRNAMGVKQLGQADPKLKKRLEAMQAEIFALRRDMKSKGLTEGTFVDLRIVNENVNDEIEMALTNWLNILAEGDPIKITDLYLDNGVLLGTVAKEIKQGHTEIQAYFDMFLKKSPIGSVDTFILQNFGDICISDGTYTFELDGEDGQRASVSARYTYVWKKVDGKWMIATHHSSVNP